MEEIDPVSAYITIQSATQLVNVVKNFEDINDYDYNKMMSDFEMTARHEDHLKKIRRKWMEEGKKYKQKIERMKEEREEQYQKKNKALQRKLKEKDQLLLTALDASKKEKMAEKQKAIELLTQKEQQAKENVEKNLEEQEKERLLAAEMTNEKSIFCLL